MKDIILTELQDIEMLKLKIKLEEEGKSSSEIDKAIELLKDKMLLENKEEELENKIQNTEKNVKTLNDFKESSGKLSDNKRIVFDLKSGKDLLIEDGQVEQLENGRVVLSYLRQFYPYISSKELMDAIPSAKVFFNPKKKLLSKDKDGMTMLNLFDEEKTMYPMIEARDETERRHDDLDFLNETPHIKLLFRSVFGDNDLDYVINWLATCFITRSKVRTTLVVQSKVGTGKGQIVGIVRKGIQDRDHYWDCPCTFFTDYRYKCHYVLRSGNIEICPWI